MFDVILAFFSFVYMCNSEYLGRYGCYHLMARNKTDRVVDNSVGNNK